MATLHKFHVGDETQSVSLQSINKYVICYTTASGGYYYIVSGTPSNYILKYFTTTADMRSKQMIINIDYADTVAFYQANSTAQNTRPTLINPSSYTYERTATGYKYTIPANTLTDTYLFVTTYLTTNTYSSYEIPDTAQMGDLTEWRDGTLDECNSNIWSGTGILHEYSASQTLEAETYSYDSGVALRYVNRGSSKYPYWVYEIQGVNGAGSVRYLIIPPGVTTFTTTNAPIAMQPTISVPTIGVGSTSQLTPTSTEGDNRTYTITASAYTQYVILLNGITQSATSYCANNSIGTGVLKAFWT